MVYGSIERGEQHRSFEEGTKDGEKFSSTNDHSGARY